jgi:hypothetical protein
VNVDQPWPFRAVIPVVAEAAEQIRARWPMTVMGIEG